MTRAVLLLTPLAFALACQAADKPPTDFSVLPKLAEAIAKADKVVLFEGLPHQGNEPELLKKELADKKTVQIAGYPFYAETLELKDGHGKKLTELTAGKDTFDKFGGEKKCGGYHPDYAVEFLVGADKYHALICFGCSEAIITGPKATVRCDMNKDEGYKAFAAILKEYRKNRPASKD